MRTKLLGCLAATAMGTAIVVATPALAFRGGGFGGGLHGGFGGAGFHRGFGGGGFRGGMFTGRSVFVPGGNRFVGRSVVAGSFNRAGRFDRDDRFGRRFGRFDRDDRFRHRFGRFDRDHRFAFVNGFDNFAFFGVPFGYDYAAYGNGCWRQVWTPYGWQWSNICYEYGY